MSKERVVVSFELDREVNDAMVALCDALGLSMSTAFTVFAKRMVRDSGFPFALRADPFDLLPDPFDLAEDPFYSPRNQARLRKSIEEMERHSAQKRASEPAEDASKDSK